MFCTLKTVAQYKVVLWIRKAAGKNPDEFTWINEANFLNNAKITRTELYRTLRWLIDYQVIEVEQDQKNRRKRLYRINQNVTAWGNKIMKADEERRRATVLSLVPKAPAVNTPRKPLFGVCAALYLDEYAPRGESWSVPLSKFASWPAPMLRDPTELDDYVRKATAHWKWETNFDAFLLWMLKKERFEYIHPDDVKATVDQVNRLQLSTHDEYWAYCFQTMRAKWNDRRQKMDLEVHEWRKKGTL